MSLEKLYLTEQVTSQRVRNTNDSNSVSHGRRDSDAVENYDLWEKRQLKAMTKLRKELLKTLQALQLHYEVKASIMKDSADEDQSSQKQAESVLPSGPADKEFVASFTDFVTKVVIEPFGGRLYQPVYDLASELDLSDRLLEQIKEKAQL